MGTYYDSYLAHGLLIPGDEDVELALDTDDMYEWLHQNIPPGFTYLSGGDWVNAEYYHFVVTARKACVQTMDSAGSGFGVVEARQPEPLNLPETEALRKFAKQHGLEFLLGWWGVNSCG